MNMKLGFKLCTAVPPKMMPFTFGDDPLELSQSTTVQCSVTTGDLPLNIKWLFNGKLISDVQDVIVSKINKYAAALSIESVSAKHVGNYTCVGRNAAGNASYTSQLLLNGSFHLHVLCISEYYISFWFSFI